ncbi:hypothetical protein [Pisciglobus halotolerans]|uniref:Uncharacterized protein n=1 Tax=Pisciglobus halotolerans TaxID=745365 RepID=A0A1I3ARJ3_9LACT|nr:hypothetical protein [Pisciglobus halotolerans]SFH52634.1 hypothetical protein SAMN04489868_101161 [Pisciglobus halotolerans]
MKEWHIHNQDYFHTLLLEHVTFLKGNKQIWNFLLDDLQQYFSNKATPLKIYQDATLLPRNDFSFIAFSPNEDFDSKALQQIMKTQKKQFLNTLTFSPFYKALADSWEELIEEVEFLNNQNSSASLNFSLLPFDRDWVAKNLVFSEKSYLNLSNFRKILFQLETLETTVEGKQQIICIVNPEKFLTNAELSRFYDYLEKNPNGKHYLIITESNLAAATNVFYNDTIRNKLDCFKVKNKLMKDFPANWDNQQFSIACNWYISLVDKYRDETVFLDLETVDNLETFIYLYSLFILTSTPLIVDLARIPSSLRKYFENLLLDTL